MLRELNTMDPVTWLFLISLVAPAVVGLGLEQLFPVPSAACAALLAAAAAFNWTRQVPPMPGLVQGVISSNGFCILCLHTLAWIDLTLVR